MNAKNLSFGSSFYLQKFDTLTKIDNYDVTITDIGKLIILDSTLDRIFTMPEVTISLIGQRFRFANINIGRLTIAAYITQSINGVPSISVIGKNRVIEILVKASAIDQSIIFSTEGQISDVWE